MSRIQRLKTLARVYLKNGPVVHLTGRPAQMDHQIQQTQDDVMREVRYALTENQPIDAVTTDGDAVLIPARNVQDVVFPAEVQAEPVVVVPAQVFWGKAIHVRHFPAWLAENPDAANGCQFGDADPDQYTVVVGEDLAQAEIVVVNVSTGHVAWANPACPEEAIVKSVAAAVLLGEAEELTNIAYNEHQTPLENQDLQVADVENANAHMARGDVRAALNIAGSEFVTAYLREGGSDVCVHVEAGVVGDYSGYGVINGGYDEAQGEFVIGLFEDPGEVRRRVEYIDEVVAYEWAEYQRTGNPEALTEYGRRVVDQLPVPNEV